MSTDITAPRVEGAKPTPSRRWMPWFIVLLAVLVVGGVLAGVLLSRGSSDHVSSQQLAELQQACSQWKSSSTALTPPSDWCDNLSGWMSDHADNPGMWATPEAMQTSCQVWSAANPGDASEGHRIAWCNEMVSWMQQHAAQWGSWNGWMTHGPMMG